jgi:hypothetical protein
MSEEPKSPPSITITTKDDGSLRVQIVNGTPEMMWAASKWLDRMANRFLDEREMAMALEAQRVEEMRARLAGGGKLT